MYQCCPNLQITLDGRGSMALQSFSLAAESYSAFRVRLDPDEVLSLSLLLLWLCLWLFLLTRIVRDRNVIVSS